MVKFFLLALVLSAFQAGANNEHSRVPIGSEDNSQFSEGRFPKMRPLAPRKEDFSKACRNFSDYGKGVAACLNYAWSLEQIKQCRLFSGYLDPRVACIRFGKSLELIKACKDFSGYNEGRQACITYARKLEAVQYCKEQNSTMEGRIDCIKDE